MPWGVFTVQGSGPEKIVLSQHVMPCEDDYKFREPHTLASWCPCHPRKEIQPGGVPLFIHNDMD